MELVVDVVFIMGWGLIGCKFISGHWLKELFSGLAQAENRLRTVNALPSADVYHLFKTPDLWRFLVSFCKRQIWLGFI